MAPILPAQTVFAPCHRSGSTILYSPPYHMRFYQIHICCADSRIRETKCFDNLQLGRHQTRVAVVAA